MPTMRSMSANSGSRVKNSFSWYSAMTSGSSERSTDSSSWARTWRSRARRLRSTTSALRLLTRPVSMKAKVSKVPSMDGR